MNKSGHLKNTEQNVKAGGKCLKESKAGSFGGHAVKAAPSSTLTYVVIKVKTHLLPFTSAKKTSCHSGKRQGARVLL